MPLLLLSGILLPMALAPDWLQFLSTLNPLTHAVDAARALFNGQWGDPEIAIGVGVTAVLAVIAVWIASRTFSRANAVTSLSVPPGSRRRSWIGPATMARTMKAASATR